MKYFLKTFNVFPLLILSMFSCTQKENYLSINNLKSVVWAGCFDTYHEFYFSDQELYMTSNQFRNYGHRNFYTIRNDSIIVPGFILAKIEKLNSKVLILKITDPETGELANVNLKKIETNLIPPPYANIDALKSEIYFDFYLKHFIKRMKESECYAPLSEPIELPTAGMDSLIDSLKKNKPPTIPNPND